MRSSSPRFRLRQAEFERFLEAIRGPNDPEHEEFVTWAGGDYDPDVFDLRTVRHAVLLASAWGAR